MGGSPYKAVSVARSLIWLASQEGQTIDSLRLQKLLYYVQAWSLVVRGEQMFREEIQAFEYGPVVYSVWKKFRQQEGRSSIPTEEGRPDVKGPDLAFIASVWDDYKGLSIEEIMHLVHEVEPIWKKHFRPFDGSAPSPKIPKKEIEEYFRSQLGKPIPRDDLKAFVERHQPPEHWFEEPSPFTV